MRQAAGTCFGAGLAPGPQGGSCCDPPTRRGPRPSFLKLHQKRQGAPPSRCSQSLGDCLRALLWDFRSTVQAACLPVGWAHRTKHNTQGGVGQILPVQTLGFTVQLGERTAARPMWQSQAWSMYTGAAGRGGESQGCNCIPSLSYTHPASVLGCVAGRMAEQRLPSVAPPRRAPWDVGEGAGQSGKG